MQEQLVEQLVRRLAQPLPGPVVRRRFGPWPCPWEYEDSPPAKARLAAVLVLLYPWEGRWWLPLTLRPPHMADHAGQVSLPGGAVEAGETEAAAALREFHEELGDDGQPIRLLGKLSPIYVRTSNFWVTPWVAAAEHRPAFVASRAEVAEVLEVPLGELLDPGHLGVHPRQYQGHSYMAPHFLFGSHRIWGATCLILGELVAILEGVEGEEGFRLEDI
jgi:8-oxo-dGTP pyrophosphatase MutT (NUDIX family)